MTVPSTSCAFADAGVHRRISRLLSEHLTRVLMGKTATPFLEPAIERAEAAGKRRNVIGEYGSFDVEEPG